MTHDPLRRRFGHGAARLPIGTSTQGPSLSQLARRRVAGERIFAGAPAGFCLTLALLLFLAMRIDFSAELPVVPRALAPQLAEHVVPDEMIPPLTLEFWAEEAPSQANPAAEQPSITPTPVVIVADRKSAPIPDARAIPSQVPIAIDTPPSAPFDPARLVLSAPAAVPLGDPMRRPPTPNSARKASHRPTARITATPRPHIDLPTPGEAAPADLLAAGSAGPAKGSTARPGAGRANPSPDTRTPNWSANADQRAFLTAQAEAASGAGSSAGEPHARARLSPVSAAVETRIQAERIRDQLLAGGWQQVPLDTLPDCNPAGRQDELKRHIIRAAADQSSCTHPQGSFKFVETSNLGAFLMWSRTQPETLASRGRDRDACVVLERALLCLTGSSVRPNRSALQSHTFHLSLSFHLSISFPCPIRLKGALESCTFYPVHRGAGRSAG